MLLASVVALGSANGADPVALVTADDYAPFADRRLPDGGLAPAIVRAAYAHVPAELAEIAFTDWRRGYRALRDGRYTGGFPYAKTAERQEVMYFSEPIYVTEARAAVNARTSVTIGDAEDLVGLTYCAPEDDRIPAGLAEMTEAGHVFGVRRDRLVACARMLRRERVDFVPTLEPVFRRVAEAAFGGTSAFRFSAAVLERRARHVIFPKSRDGAEAAVATFNRGLARVKESGRWREIVARFLD